MYNSAASAVVQVVRALRDSFRSGKPLPTTVGLIIGGTIGGAGGAWLGHELGAGYYTVFVVIPALMVGTVIGATAAAMAFPRPRTKSLPRPGGATWESLGAIKRRWTAAAGRGKWHVVLLERGIYAGVEGRHDWYTTKERLAAGENPHIPGGRSIPFERILSIELPAPRSFWIVVDYNDDDPRQTDEPRSARAHLVFQSLGEREEFLKCLEQQFRKSFYYEPEKVGFWHSTRKPLLAVTILVLIIAGESQLSVYWKTNPPRSQDGSFGVAPLFQSFIDLGPSGVIAWGIVPLILALAWFLKRAFWPRRIHILKID